MRITVRQLKRLIREAIEGNSYEALYNTLSNTTYIDELVEHHGDKNEALATVFESAKDVCKTGKFANLFKNYKAVASAKAADVSELKRLKKTIHEMEWLQTGNSNSYHDQYLSTTIDDINTMEEDEGNEDYPQDPENFEGFIVACKAICEGTSGVNQLIDSANSGDSEAESLLTQFGISV